MSGRLMKRVQLHRASRRSPSSKLTQSTSPGCCSVRTSSETRVRPLYPLPICSADRYLTSRYLATCSADTTVKIWSVSPSFEFRLDKALQGHQRWVWDCAFSADSAYLVTGVYITLVSIYDIGLNFTNSASSDHTARLWEMASGETVRQYNGHHKGMEPLWAGLSRFFQTKRGPFFVAAVCCALHDGAG